MSTDEAQIHARKDAEEAKRHEEAEAEETRKDAIEDKRHAEKEAEENRRHEQEKSTKPTSSWF